MVKHGFAFRGTVVLIALLVSTVSGIARAMFLKLNKSLDASLDSAGGDIDRGRFAAVKV